MEMIRPLMSAPVMRFLFAAAIQATVLWKLVEGFSNLKAASVKREDGDSFQFVIQGGAGKIGTAVACHLLLRAPENSEIILVGRQLKSGKNAVQQVMKEFAELSSSPVKDGAIQFELVSDVWDNSDPKLRAIVDKCDCLIHTAGPFLDRSPTPLQLAIDLNCPAYIDISDPVAFLETSLLKSDSAREAGTTAVLAAGAFPGMSNVLANEAASALGTSRIGDVRFHYFTAGLGGSGPLNLYITNLGFGEPMVQFDRGELRFFTALSGRLLGEVDFFLPNNQMAEHGFGNELAEKRVGRRQVFAWPFPEAATVPKLMGSQGSSYACMGTAPHLWNVMLGILVGLVPRALWKKPAFSLFMAKFSEPLVWITDQILKMQDESKVGETHAMRIDVTSMVDPDIAVSVVQAHDSFRQCVGQSCAEFALDALMYPSPGVQMTEQRYLASDERLRIISKLTSTPGTFAYTGPCVLKEVELPGRLTEALWKAEKEEP